MDRIYHFVGKTEDDNENNLKAAVEKELASELKESIARKAIFLTIVPVTRKSSKRKKGLIYPP